MPTSYSKYMLYRCRSTGFCSIGLCKVVQEVCVMCVCANQGLDLNLDLDSVIIESSSSVRFVIVEISNVSVTRWTTRIDLIMIDRDIRFCRISKCLSSYHPEPWWKTVRGASELRWRISENKWRIFSFNGRISNDFTEWRFQMLPLWPCVKKTRVFLLDSQWKECHSFLFILAILNDLNETRKQGPLPLELDPCHQNLYDPQSMKSLSRLIQVCACHATLVQE